MIAKAAVAFLVVVVAALWVVADRLNVALGVLLDTKAATGHWYAPGTTGRVAWWAVVVAGIVLTALLARVVVRAPTLGTEPAALAPAGVAVVAVWAVWGTWDAVVMSARGRRVHKRGQTPFMHRVRDRPAAIAHRSTIS